MIKIFKKDTKNICRRLKKNNIFGDYILAARETPDRFRLSLYQYAAFEDYEYMLLGLPTWADTPQGVEFWDYQLHHKLGT